MQIDPKNEYSQTVPTSGCCEMRQMTGIQDV
jgi:hypothetical protein